MNYYELLGVKEDASQKAIDAAYRTMTRRLSREVLDSETDIVVNLRRIVDDAYAVLSNGSLRQKYDLEGKSSYILSDDEALIRSFQDNQYRVEVIKQPVRSASDDNLVGLRYDHIVSLPSNCVCCFTKEPDKKLEVKKSKFLYALRELLVISFPICKECEKHNHEARLLFFILTIAPAVISAILTKIIWGKPDQASFTYIVMPAFSLALFFIAAFLIKFKRKSLHHASHNVPVKIKRFNSNKLAIVFENWAYAQAFAQANHGTLIIKRKRNHVVSRRFLFGYYPLDSAIVYLMLWTLIVWFFVFMF